MITKIHVIDIQEKPDIGSNVTTNCGKRLEFRPIHVGLHDPKICKNCLIVHNSLQKGVSEIYTFTLQNEKEEERGNGSKGNK